MSRTQPVNWTITPGVTPEGAAPGETFFEVNGDDADPHDARYFPSLIGAVGFLVTHHLKRDDTVFMAGGGSPTGRELRVGLVMVGEAIEYDVGEWQLPNPEELLAWLVLTLKPGDTVSYLPT